MKNMSPIPPNVIEELRRNRRVKDLKAGDPIHWMIEGSDRAFVVQSANIRVIFERRDGELLFVHDKGMVREFDLIFPADESAKKWLGAYGGA